MKTYTIKELEIFSGIKAHTLRMWEKRYAVFTPLRTTGMNRLYSINDLHKVLLLSFLSKNGFRISHLSKMANEKLEKLAEGLTRTAERQEKAVNDLVIYMQRVETELFENIIDTSFASWPADIVLQEIIYPFLQKTGLMWKGNRLTEEHFVVTAIRSKIIAATEKITGKERNDRLILLFLPEKGQLDLLLLYTNYILKRNGCRVLYMGSDVSVANLKTAIQLKQPGYIFTYLQKTTHLNIPDVAAMMNAIIPATRLIIALNRNDRTIKTNYENVVYLEYKNALSFMCGEHFSKN